MYSQDPSEVFEAVEFLKNVSIGSNRQKDTIIQMGLVANLLDLLEKYRDHHGMQNLLIEIVAILNSLAKGTDEHCQRLIDLGVIGYLINIVINPNSSPAFLEMTLKTLRSLFSCSYAPVTVIYEWDGPGGSDGLIQRLLELPSLQLPSVVTTYSIQECVFNILSKSLEKTSKERQCLLKSKNAIPLVANSLSSPACKVKLAALDFLARVTYQNDEVSRTVVITAPSVTKTQVDTNGNGDSILGRKFIFQTGPIVTVPDILTQMMSQECTPVMQLSAAKCMAYLYRAGAICPEDKRIVYKTLPTLVRSCKPDRDPLLRAEAAKVLAYLTEVDTNLQLTAAHCDQVIPTIASLLRYSVSLPSSHRENRHQEISHDSDDIEMYCSDNPIPPATAKKIEREEQIQNELMQAAFRAFASLGANDEEIRKKIFETDGLMEHLISGLTSSNIKIRIASLRCLHSLSRSVQQLRSSFQDHAIWPPLRTLLSNSTDEVLFLVSSTLCNLLVEYPPGKPNLLNDRSTIEQLCQLTHRQEGKLRVNGVLALMNMVMKADQSQKSEILRILTIEQIFQLLDDEDVNVVLKTLGLLRNLLSTKAHTDHIMLNHGKDIMNALSKILNSKDQPVEVKEQSLCVLANIAHGDTSKDLIMTSDDILHKLNSILEEDEVHVRLQIASAFVITNLAWAEDEGCGERQMKLREIGVYKNLDNLVTTSDTDLFDKVKTALHQFSN